MKIKKVGLMALILLLIGGFTSEGIVKADDEMTMTDMKKTNMMTTKTTTTKTIIMKTKR